MLDIEDYEDPKNKVLISNWKNKIQTWKSSVLINVIDGVWIRLKRVIDCVNDVKLWFVDLHERGKWVIVVEWLQSIVFVWTQVQSINVLNRCGQLLLLLRWTVCNCTRWLEMIKRKKNIWYWLKKNGNIYIFL